MELEKLNPEELLSAAKELQSKVADQDIEIGDLKTAALDKEKECAEHTKMIDDQAAQINQLNAVIGSAKPQTSVEMESSKKAAPVIPADVIKVGEKDYKWNRATFRLPGNPVVYTAQEAGSNEELLKELLQLEGQKVLIEQV